MVLSQDVDAAHAAFMWIRMLLILEKNQHGVLPDHSVPREKTQLQFLSLCSLSGIILAYLEGFLSGVIY